MLWALKIHDLEINVLHTTILLGTEQHIHPNLTQTPHMLLRHPGTSFGPHIGSAAHSEPGSQLPVAGHFLARSAEVPQALRWGQSAAGASVAEEVRYRHPSTFGQSRHTACWCDQTVGQ